MSISELVDRIDLIARRVAIFATLAGAALWIGVYLIAGHGSLLELTILIAFPLVLAIILWLLSWIIEAVAGTSNRGTQSETKVTRA